MSIWCSEGVVGFDPLNMDGTAFPDQAVGGQVRSYATGFSNHYPTIDGEWEQPASVDLATIAPWCVPGAPESVDHPDTGPWLRLEVLSHVHDWVSGGLPTGKAEGAMVVLDEGAVLSLRDQLTEWLERPKVHPPEVAADDGPGLFEESTPVTSSGSIVDLLGALQKSVQAAKDARAEGLG